MSQTQALVFTEIQKHLPKATASFIAACCVIMMCNWAAKKKFEGAKLKEATAPLVPLKRIAAALCVALATLWGICFWAGAPLELLGQRTLVDAIDSIFFFGLLVPALGAGACLFALIFVSRRKT